MKAFYLIFRLTSRSVKFQVAHIHQINVVYKINRRHFIADAFLKIRRCTFSKHYRSYSRDTSIWFLKLICKHMGMG